MINLADVLDETPRNVVEFDLARVDIGKLTLLELLDAADAADVPIEDFRENLFDPNKQAHLFYAIAWVILRRQDKVLTYEGVCEYDLIVTGELDAEEMERTAARAKSIVAVAQIARVTPEAAGQMTMAEVEASVELQVARNRAARRGRRH